VRCSCGHLHEREARCEARIGCGTCARDYWRRTHARARDAVVAADAAELRENRGRPSARIAWCPTCECDHAEPQRRFLRLLTLTVRHTGDLERDRATLEKGWKRLRAQLAKRGLRRVRFFRTYEITPGVDSLGHVHVHVIVWLPWVCYAWLSAAWARATDDASTGVRVTRDTRGLPADSAAAYVATYATKGSGSQLDARLAADWYAASYGRRALASSRALMPEPDRSCPGCGASDWEVERVERPVWVPPSAPVIGGPNGRYPPRPPPNLAEFRP
jgi:hypothetical protein